MADIKVERRRTGSVWMWVAGLVLVALLVWALSMFFGGDDTGAESYGGESIGSRSAPAPALAVSARIS